MPGRKPKPSVWIKLGRGLSSLISSSAKVALRVERHEHFQCRAMLQLKRMAGVEYNQDEDRFERVNCGIDQWWPLTDDANWYSEHPKVPGLHQVLGHTHEEFWGEDGLMRKLKLFGRGVRYSTTWPKLFGLCVEADGAEGAVLPVKFLSNASAGRRRNSGGKLYWVNFGHEQKNDMPDNTFHAFNTKQSFGWLTRTMGSIKNPYGRCRRGHALALSPPALCSQCFPNSASLRSPPAPTNL